MLKNIDVNKKALSLDQEGIKTPPSGNFSSFPAQQRASTTQGHFQKWESASLWQKHGRIVGGMRNSPKTRAYANEIERFLRILAYKDMCWLEMTNNHPILQEAIRRSEISTNALNVLSERYPLLNENSTVFTPSSTNSAWLILETFVQPETFAQPNTSKPETSNQRILRWCEEEINQKTGGVA